VGTSAADRVQMLGQLAHAVRRTHELQQYIRRQRARLQRLRRDGQDIVNEELALAQLEQSQMSYKTESARLESKLEKLNTIGIRLRSECRRSGP
jgi:predicted  nucleic acid-binding Zn-ribbon protein